MTCIIMVRDNNDEVKEQLDKMEKKLKSLLKQKEEE